MKIKYYFYILYAIMAILFCTFLIKSYYAYQDRYLAFAFNGRVEYIEYDSKGYPIVMINDKDYPLAVGWNYYHTIEVGDSMKKDSGKMTIILVKSKTGKVLRFSHL